jgi:hypothetical protein
MYQDQAGLIPGMQDVHHMKAINAIYHMSRNEGQNHVIILVNQKRHVTEHNTFS